MRIDRFVSGRFRKAAAGALCATAVLLLAMAAPPAQAGGGAPPTTKVQTKKGYGITVTLFNTLLGGVAVALPDTAAPGDTISGTMSVVPGNNGAPSSDDRTGWEILGRHTVALGEVSRPVQAKTLTCTVPTGAHGQPPALALVLSDERGNVLARTQVRLAIPPAAPAAAGAVALPQSGSAGHPLVIPGRFDGNAANTRVLIGSTEAEVLAEPPHKVVVQSPDAPRGRTQIAVHDGGLAVAAGEYDNRGPRRRGSGLESAFKAVGNAVAGVLQGVVYLVLLLFGGCASAPGYP